MTTFTPLRVVLLVATGLVGAIIGALTGAFYGLFGWMGIWPAIILGALGALLMVVEVNEVSNAQRVRLAIGLLLGAAFGVVWAQLGGGALAPTLGHAANWAVYGFFASSVTHETLLKVKRWTIWGAATGLILGIVFAVFNISVSLGATITLKPHRSFGEAAGAIILTIIFVAFWASVIGLQHSTPDNRQKAASADQASEFTQRRLRPIRKVLR